MGGDDSSPLSPFLRLLPIMGERASASPVIDSEKGIDTTDDSSDSLSDSASQSTYVPKDPPIAGKKLAKDVLQVGDIITYMATTTDREKNNANYQDRW